MDASRRRHIPARAAATRAALAVAAPKHVVEAHRSPSTWSVVVFVSHRERGLRPTTSDLGRFRPPSPGDCDCRRRAVRRTQHLLRVAMPATRRRPRARRDTERAVGGCLAQRHRRARPRWLSTIPRLDDGNDADSHSLEPRPKNPWPSRRTRDGGRHPLRRRAARRVARRISSHRAQSSTAAVMERGPALDALLHGWCRASATRVRSIIAATILEAPGAAFRLGSIALLPHQPSAVQRLESAIDRFNGALLCDYVGMGKTYRALAVSRKFARRLIVVPSALVPMWRSALEACDTDAAIVTFEALSRADLSTRRRPSPSAPESYDLVIVDEAHHARNQRTNRYLALESLVRGAGVLLLSATPIHNQRRDLAALLSLFIGSRAHTLTSAELALCVIRREQHQLRHPLGIPVIRPVSYHDLPDDPILV